MAGTAAGLLATGRVPADEARYRAKVLHVDAGAAHEIALVDVCVSTVPHVGSRALWQPATLREVYCAFAEPHAIGLSSIAGLLHPAARTDPHGVVVRLAGRASRAAHRVRPDRAGGGRPDRHPGRPARCRPASRTRVAVERGTVAVDGEREIEFGPADPGHRHPRADGPRVLDVRAVLAAAAERRLLVSGAPRAPPRRFDEGSAVPRSRATSASTTYPSRRSARARSR